MQIQHLQQWSGHLDRTMNIRVYGHAGAPIVVFPCQDGMCDNWEGFQMLETLEDFIEGGSIQLFCVDTVDRESWSAAGGDNEWRANVQESYYRYVVDETLPYVREVNGTGILPFTCGFSLGATHAAIVFLRRPDLFSGVLGCSGAYDACYFWDGWMNGTLYENSPAHFLPNLPADHHYVDLYNHRRIALVVGQGAWEDEGRRSLAVLRDAFQAKGVNAWCDFWGYDVNHDWPWWRKQIRYFLPWLLEGCVWA